MHQSSTDAASSLLVTALNEGRDVIMDGTLSWEPFVEQTIAMARAVHRRRYRMGIGYSVQDDGSVVENYWEQVADEEDDAGGGGDQRRKPYRIELVGVVCDTYLAVVRGIRSSSSRKNPRKGGPIAGVPHFSDQSVSEKSQAGYTHQAGGESELPAQVPPEICERLPQVLPARRQRQALLHQRHGNAAQGQQTPETSAAPVAKLAGDGFPDIFFSECS